MKCTLFILFIALVACVSAIAIRPDNQQEQVVKSFDDHINNLMTLAQGGDEYAFSTLEIMSTTGNTMAAQALKNCTQRVVGAALVDPSQILKPNGFILPGEHPIDAIRHITFDGKIAPAPGTFDDPMARSFAEAGAEIEDTIFQEIKAAENAAANGEAVAEADSGVDDTIDMEEFDVKSELVTEGKTEAVEVDQMQVALD